MIVRSDFRLVVHVLEASSSLSSSSCSNLASRTVWSDWQLQPSRVQHLPRQPFMSLTSLVRQLSRPFVSTWLAVATRKQRIVIAIGGTALQRRGEALTTENQLKAALAVAPMLKAIAQEHEVVLTHGNGPQVGALALERSTAPLDVLVAESQSIPPSPTQRSLLGLCMDGLRPKSWLQNMGGCSSQTWTTSAA